MPPSEHRRHRSYVMRLALLAGLWGEPCLAEPGSAVAPGRAIELPSESPAAAPLVVEPSEPAAASSVEQFLLELAKQRFNRGVLEKDRAQLERALDALRFGYSLSQDPALAFNAARVARELGHCAEVRFWYETFLARESKPERRQRAERQLAELAPCDPNQPTESAWVLPAQSAEVLSAPAWRLSSAKPVSWPEFESSPSAPAGAAARPWFWGAAGAAGVSAVLTGVFLVQASSKDAALEELQPDPADPQATEERIQQLQSEGRAAQTRAQVFGLVALGLGVTATVGLWVTRPQTPADSELLFQASPEGAMASWREHF
ncbi:MAG TPA: hypothetical protein VJU61_24590 [Polyangiaceae bacterium]|nr:hypothetical protein [Polyangiaceae bacterium]